MYHIIEQCHYVGLGPTQGYQTMEITLFPTYARHKALSSWSIFLLHTNVLYGLGDALKTKWISFLYVDENSASTGHG